MRHNLRFIQFVKHFSSKFAETKKLLLLPTTILRTWAIGFLRDVSGPHGYRTLAVAVSVYFALYALFEAAHERQMTRATFEHAMLINMVSSNNRQLFIAAMKNFGRIQTMSIIREPSLLEPGNWLSSDTPNFLPLHTWARYFLSECTAKECGITCKENCDDDGLQYRIDLHGANLQRAGLCYADLNSSRLVRADVREADLRFADLTRSDLRGTDLRGANLRYAKFDGVLFGSNQGDHRFTARLNGADLFHADLRGARDLNCSVLKDTKNWERSCRDEHLLCGGGKVKLKRACEVDADLFSCWGEDQNEMKRWRVRMAPS